MPQAIRQSGCKINLRLQHGRVTTAAHLKKALMYLGTWGLNFLKCRDFTPIVYTYPWARLLNGNMVSIFPDSILLHRNLSPDSLNRSPPFDIENGLDRPEHVTTTSVIQIKSTISQGHD